MQKAFEKIVERLEEEIDDVIVKDTYSKGKNAGFRKAKIIVKEVAEEYKRTSHFGCNNNGEHERCEDCGVADNCQDYKKELFESTSHRNDDLVIGDSHSNYGWIPCSEQLPEEHKLYDITTKNDTGIHSDSAIFNPFIQRWLWDADETELVEIEVLAWAEKRKPYQQRGE